MRSRKSRVSISLRKRFMLVVKSIRYDYLLLATGSTTNYYGKSSIAHNSMTLKTEKDAEKIRLSLEQALLNAAKASSLEKQEKLLSVNIIGGGPTGVELACEIVPVSSPSTADNSTRRLIPKRSMSISSKVLLLSFLSPPQGCRMLLPKDSSERVLL
jgi:NADH dehydrogenase FAD-containing subunit